VSSPLKRRIESPRPPAAASLGQVPHPCNG